MLFSLRNGWLFQDKNYVLLLQEKIPLPKKTNLVSREKIFLALYTENFLRINISVIDDLKYFPVFF